ARRMKLRRRSGARGIDGNVAPPDRLLALPFDRLDEQPLELLPPCALVRQEADDDPVAPRRRQVELACEERVRDLDEDPRAVAGLCIGAGGAAMLEPLERVERPRDHLVAR